LREQQTSALNQPPDPHLQYYSPSSIQVPYHDSRNSQFALLQRPLKFYAGSLRFTCSRDCHLESSSN